MTHTTKAIELAIKGGYTKDGNEYPSSYSIEFICLDPEFWQSLGKSLGWGSNKECNRCGIHINGWKAHWHRFIDFLAEGKTPEQFFEKLLANEKYYSITQKNNNYETKNRNQALYNR